MSERVAGIIARARETLTLRGREVRSINLEVDTLTREIFGDQPRIDFSVAVPIDFGSPEMARRYGAYGVSGKIRISRVSGYRLSDSELKSAYASIQVDFLQGSLSIVFEDRRTKAEYSEDRQFSHRDRLNELSRLKVIREVLGSVVQLKKDGLLEEVTDDDSKVGVQTSIKPFVSPPSAAETTQRGWGLSADELHAAMAEAYDFDTDKPFATSPTLDPIGKAK